MSVSLVEMVLHLLVLGDMLVQLWILQGFLTNWFSLPGCAALNIGYTAVWSVAEEGQSRDAARGKPAGLQRPPPTEEAVSPRVVRSAPAPLPNPRLPPQTTP